jgi:hypothetical protein
MIAMCKCGQPINVIRQESHRGVELVYRSSRGIQSPLTKTCPACGQKLPDCLQRVRRQTSEELMVTK